MKWIIVSKPMTGALFEELSDASEPGATKGMNSSEGDTAIRGTVKE